MLRRILSSIRGRELDATARAAAEHWDRESQVRSVYWTEPPIVRAHVNELISGVAWLSPTQALKAGWAYNPLPRGLSIGCGTGALERDIWRQRICLRVEGTDISRTSLATARRLAAEEGMRGITYRRESFNDLKLRPSHYDIVFFHGSLHHVTDPDACLAEVENGLKPHGLLYIDEYVGPSRGEWGEEHLCHVREEYDRVDEALHRYPVAPPVAPGDPSEMIRSSRILPAIEERFEIL
ncbi:MAG: class I SAM-dependent methyltransferase, partial [Acidobacteriota bacterium]